MARNKKSHRADLQAKSNVSGVPGLTSGSTIMFVQYATIVAVLGVAIVYYTGDTAPGAESMLPEEVTIREQDAPDDFTSVAVQRLLEKEEQIMRRTEKYWNVQRQNGNHAPEKACPEPIKNFKSMNGDGTEIDVAFKNGFSDSLTIYWVSHTGEEVSMGELSPGQGSPFQSYTGHAWRARTEDGTIVAEIIAKQGMLTVQIEACRATSLPSDEEIAEKASFDPESHCPNIRDWLNAASKAPGYHPLCVKRDSASNSMRFEVTAFLHGDGTSPPVSTHIKITPPYDSEEAQRTFRGAVEKLVRMRDVNTDGGRAARKGKKEYYPQPWRVFDTDGSSLEVQKHTSDLWHFTDLESVSGLVLLFEGGQFIYPGVQIGHKRMVHVHDINVTIQTLSLQPLVFSVNHFLHASECSHIIKRSTAHMAPSGVSLMDKDKGRAATDFRTSSTYFLPATGDPLLKNIDVRVAALTHVPVKHQEDVQVLLYNKGQHYGAHLDYWDTGGAYTDPGVVQMTEGGHKNRLVTVFWYMSNVTLGGETNFPLAIGFPAIDDANVAPQCRHGLRVRPQEGKVIVFYSLLPNGSGDQKSQHGACPVKLGVKWAANKWVWNKKQGFV